MKKTNLIQTLVLTSLLLSTQTLLAMGKRAPASDPVVTPKPPAAPSQPPVVSNPSPVTREPAAVFDRLTPGGYDPFVEVAQTQGPVVDEKYRSYRELMVNRSLASAHYTDTCDPALDTKATFADRIAHAIEIKMQPSRAQLGYVGSLFGMSSDVSTYQPNSLISHPLCIVSQSTLNTTLAGKNVPSADVITKINRFAQRMNQYRREALAGRYEGYQKASQLWGKFFMCLSYAESLTTADTQRSSQVASKYAPSDYRRPAGVNFYEDPYQPEASRLNIGMFQFTPTASGNIQACLREWNQVYPKCTVSTKAPTSELIRILGSSLQTFNSFCALAKTTGMFSVQINTANAKSTHPANIRENGQLKSASERCVSPHMAVGRSYNHFGPYQNGMGTTLGKLMSCVDP